MKRALLTFAWLLFSGLLHAQTAWWVDPVGGSDAANGSGSAPFQTLGHALSQAVGGDTITLMDGSYSSLETFPIQLKNGVSISADSGATPVFDGGGVGVTVFQLSQNVSTTTSLAGVTITDCSVGVYIPSGTSVFGFTIDGCSFTDFKDHPGTASIQEGWGVYAVLDSGGSTESFTVSDCSFVGGVDAEAGIFLLVDSATTLTAGGLTDNTSTGGVDFGIDLQVTGKGEVASSYGVHRNVFSGYRDAGIRLFAYGESGATSVSTSTLAAAMDANSLTGSGALGQHGLRLRTESGLLGSGAEITSWCASNLFTGNEVNIHCVTVNDSGALADIEADFRECRIENGTRAGVECSATLPNGLNSNCDPGFGPGRTGKPSLMNTFSGNAKDFILNAGVVQAIGAQFNFFPAGSATQSGGTVNDNNRLSSTLSGSFAASILPDTETTARLNISSSTGVVDYAGSGSIGQITVVVDGSTLEQSAITAADSGLTLDLVLPALAKGQKTVTVTNPGGQTGGFTLTVRTPSTGGEDSGGGCFVATAAHGDYDAREVRVLRDFRDRYLAEYTLGRAFIEAYYTHGPAAADWIAERPLARSTTRGLLTLPVWVAKGLLEWNPAQRFAFGVLLLGLSFRVLRRQPR